MSAAEAPSGSEVHVRPATVADLPQLGRLAAKLVRFHHALDPKRYLLVEPLERGYQAFLGSELEDRDAVVLVAERSAGQGALQNEAGHEAAHEAPRLLGYAYGRLEPRNWNELLDACGKLHDIFVEDEARGSGAGEALLRAMIARLEAMGAPRVVLLSAWQNDRAQGLFEKLGFRRTMVEMTRESSG